LGSQRSLSAFDDPMDHLEPVRKRVREAAIEPAPAPWVQAGTWAVGGLIEVGFGREADLLLVVSWQGRAVFDPATRTRVARDHEQPDDTWYDEFSLLARGIGPLADQRVPLAGLHGGGLAATTRDGWWTESITLAWPDEHLLLGGPHGSIHEAETSFVKIAVESEVRAFGFSASGRTLVVATSSDLQLYTRT
jgi:hypothetical protein